MLKVAGIPSYPVSIHGSQPVSPFLWTRCAVMRECVKL